MNTTTELAVCENQLLLNKQISYLGLDKVA